MKVTITEDYNTEGEVVWTEDFGDRTDSYVLIMKTWSNLLEFLYKDGYNVPNRIEMRVDNDQLAAYVEVRNIRSGEYETVDAFKITVD